MIKILRGGGSAVARKGIAARLAVTKIAAQTRVLKNIRNAAAVACEPHREVYR